MDLQSVCVISLTHANCKEFYVELQLLNTMFKSRSRIQFNLSKPTGYEMHQQVEYFKIARSAHTVFMCFVFV
jgi:hypothetical protein